MRINQSANQQFKESGSSLPFKNWLNREKAKGEIIPQKEVINSIEQELLDKVSDKKLGYVSESVSVKPKPKTILGLNPNVLIISALVVLGALTYKHFKKK